MNILVCPDKFKGSLSALEACQSIGSGLLRHSSGLDICLHPLADGGDGMLEVLTENIDLTLVSTQINDPLFRPIDAQYGIDETTETAYIEMSKASGLVLLQPSERNCLETSTLGAGELMLHAINRGAKRIVLGMGGSATNDAGIGLISAFGFRFYDAQGKALSPIGKNLARVDRIDRRNVLPALASVKIDLASDVQNCFFGANGAAHIFGRQKGADNNAIELLDKGLRNIARVIKQANGIDVQNIPGSGAAGGLGGGCIGLLNANIESGISMIIDATGLAEKVAQADLLISGEGMLDQQTLEGKVIDGVLQCAKKYGKPVAILCGATTLSAASIESYGISYCRQIMTQGRSLDDAMRNASHHLKELAFDLMTETQATSPSL